MSPKLFHLLMVCTGNQCRSPMAEGLLVQKLQAQNISHIIVSSAGTLTGEGIPPASDSVLVMEEEQVDISALRSEPLSADLVETADLILVMETAHKAYIHRMWPAAEKKVFLLKEFGDGGRLEDVEDPIGRERNVYRQCRDEISAELDRLLPDLINQTDEA
jgi:protein-tyrosine-phosphatase